MSVKGVCSNFINRRTKVETNSQLKICWIELSNVYLKYLLQSGILSSIYMVELCVCCFWLRSVSCVPNVASVSGLFDFVLCLVCPMLPVFLDCLTSSCVLCAQCCQCFWIVWLRPVSCVPNVASVSGLFDFVLCLVCTMSPVFLDCPVSCVPNVASVSGLSCVLCVQCCQCFWIILCLVCPMLPVFLDCPVSCVLNVASVSGLSCVLCAHCCQCFWIVRCLVCPMLPVFLDCPVSCVPNVASVSGLSILDWRLFSRSFTWLVIHTSIHLPVFNTYDIGASWWHGSWSYNCMCNQCLSPLQLWVRTLFMARRTRYNIMW